MKPAIRILYAEDNPHDADLTRSHFQQYAPDIEPEDASTLLKCADKVMYRAKKNGRNTYCYWDKQDLAQI